MKLPQSELAQARRLCVAPMMAWTDRHCRYFHRLLSRDALLYTEMVTTGALLYGNVPRHLTYHDAEHPLALQLGGNEPAALAQAARLAEQWAYDEINLNCGCPSERVQQGAFGACLMAQPQLVADCVKAMCDVVSLPITIKHRIGLDQSDDYSFVRDFVGTVAQAGCQVFIVHARNAILGGLSPKENREIPPLNYPVAYQLKQDFPTLEIIVNGGIDHIDAIKAHWQHLDGVMIGRHAYHQPYFLAQADNLLHDTHHPLISHDEVEERYCAYICAQLKQGVALTNMTRHLLGLHHGEPGARSWRRVLSDANPLATNPSAADVSALFAKARAQLQQARPPAADHLSTQ